MAENEKSPLQGLNPINGKEQQQYTENFPPAKEYAVNIPPNTDLNNIIGGKR